MKPYHRDSKLHDVCELAPTLRFEDKREVETLGHTPEQALTIGYIFSQRCQSIIDTNGHVVGMYGVSFGRVWLLGAPGLLKITKSFLKYSRSEVEIMNKLFPHLYNIIDSRNDLHIKWLRWCGFKIIGKQMLNNVKFYEFCKVAS